jgi:hypothetical protein
MGEYIQLSGERYPRKVGTCENLYYVRHAQLAEWVAQGIAIRHPGNLEPAAYLDPANGFRFRFPFPDEDSTCHLVPGDTFDFNRGYGVSHAPWFLLDGAEHRNVHAQIESRPGMWAKKRLTLPCPQRSDGYAATVEFEIVQQKPVDDALWLVVRCPYCGETWSLDTESGVALADWMTERVQGKGEWGELARRICAGYGFDTVDAPPASAARDTGSGKSDNHTDNHTAAAK